MPEIPFPQAPQPTQGLLGGNPLELMYGLNALNSLARYGSERSALGAYTNSLGPNGVPDTSSLVRGLKQSGATFGAPEVVNSALANQNTQIQNDTARFALYSGQNNYVQSILTGLANRPPNNPATADDVNSALTQIAANSDPRAVPSSVINSVRKRLLADQSPAGIKRALVDLQNTIAGPGITTTRESAPPGPGGEERTIPRGELGYGAPSSTPGPGGISPIGLPKGTPEYLTQSANEGTGLLHSAQDLPNQRALIDNLGALSTAATEGPTADLEQKLNAFTQRWAGRGITLTKDQLAAGDEYSKLVNQISQQQAVAAHATDAFLTNAYHINPQLSLSKAGREAIIPILKGNIDAQAFKANAFQQFLNGDDKANPGPHNPNEYYSWSQNFNKTFNPRIFQLQRMNPDQQGRYFQLLSRDEKEKLLMSLDFYNKKGWLAQPAQPAQPGQ